MRNWRPVNHKLVHYHTSSQAPLLRYVCENFDAGSTYKLYKNQTKNTKISDQ